MRKTDRKLDNKICEILTEVCEIALKEISGFIWLTHSVNYNSFDKSLIISCVFESKEAINKLKESSKNEYFHNLIKQEFSKNEIRVNNLKNKVVFCTENEFKNKNKSKH